MKKAIIALLLICGAVFAQQEGSFTDSRDGKEYKTVQIGEQVWFAENLNYEAEGSKCYKTKPENCEKYGRLYKWETALKACPSGWHLPSKDEYKVLDNAVGGEKVAGKKLKSSSGWKNDDNCTDEFGFSALPGGLGRSGVSFNNVGDTGYWWSANSAGLAFAYSRYINSHHDVAYWNSYGHKSDLYSVRCLQDYKKIEGKAEVQSATADAEQKTVVQKIAVQLSSFTDTRDKKTYKTVKIGKQTWMAENLNYNANGSKCYEDNESNCQEYGRLYDWNTAVKSCPKGWHLPKNEEWHKLMVSAGGAEVAGMHLKAKEGWVENGNGTDSYGFSALPGGCLRRSYDNSFSFSGVGNSGIWWSATNYSYDSEGRYEFYHYINMDPGSVTYFGDSEISPSNLFSVRCLKN